MASQVRALALQMLLALLLAKLPGSCLLRLPPPLPLLMALCFWSPLVRGLWPLRPPVSPKAMQNFRMVHRRNSGRFAFS